MGVGLRAGLGFLSLILIATSLLFMFFVVLSGVTNSTPLNKTWFLQADTSHIPGSGRAISQWTYFFVCGANNRDCGSPVAGLPIGYAWVGGTAGAPPLLVGSWFKHTTRRYYALTWRFAWVFYLIAFLFNVFAFFTALFAPCSRIASGISGLILGTSLFFFTIAVPMMTAVWVNARNAFHDAGLHAKVGSYAFGFSWGAWAAMLIATVLLWFGFGFGGTRKEPAPVAHPTRRGFFGRFRRQPAKPSSIDNESQRRVKDDYA